jgi:hypothetical protein
MYCEKFHKYWSWFLNVRSFEGQMLELVFLAINDGENIFGWILGS